MSEKLKPGQLSPEKAEWLRAFVIRSITKRICTAGAIARGARLPVKYITEVLNELIEQNIAHIHTRREAASTTSFAIGSRAEQCKVQRSEFDCLLFGQPKSQPSRSNHA